ncbi:MAG: PSD1 and planctomycete cytochrome C domain-containing protein, partial [Planctomycetota bacterium]
MGWLTPKSMADQASVEAGVVSPGNVTHSEEALEFFESRIRPLLVEHCYECHSVATGESEGGLVLDSAPAMLSGGHRGPAVLPGNVDASLLMSAVRYTDAEIEMPPAGQLEATDIADLARWIEIGMPDPRTDDLREADGAHGDGNQNPLDRDPKTHWAFQAPKLVDAKTAQSVEMGSLSARPNDVLDLMAIRAADQKGIPIEGEADRETLIRRIYFDLLGTPPTHQAIQSFVLDQRSDAFSRLVDSLLADPMFGERFGRHWLDVARYADTIGYGTAGKERRIQGSERYRDWVIHAFAQDMPYREMLRHQLAGDRTDPLNENGNLDAMGFLSIGRRYLSKHDIIDDRIDVVSRGLLGMTVTCARCHDHKFDPIPTADYYSWYGIFDSSEVVKSSDGDLPSPLAIVDKKRVADARVFVRGQPGNRGEIAPRQYLTSLRAKDDSRFRDGSGRRELADRIIAPDNPLTYRVMVNRIWAQLIGRPLVDRPSDFGFRTVQPAVPELLDDLSAEFAQHQSIKRLIRRIVMTRMYRQSSDAAMAAIETDPDNRYVARANRRRRDFESLRDSMLLVAGKCESRIGGPPVSITSRDLTPRRTIYAEIDRQNLPSLFRTFDFASPDTHSPQRYFTTVPQQALYLLNHEQVVGLAKLISADLRQTGTADGVGLFRRVLGRDPSTQERAQVQEYLSKDAEEYVAPPDPRSLWSYGTTRYLEGTPEGFTPLASFGENRWTVEKDYPSRGPFGHAMLASEMGHPGPGEHAVVRRWTAPVAGMVKISGMLGHRSKQGDGVQASIWVAGRRIFGGQQKSNNRPLNGLKSKVKAGDVIDFVVAA